MGSIWLDHNRLSVGREGNMKRLIVAWTLAVVSVTTGCRPATVDEAAWFSGTYEEALVAAQSRGTMLMLDFYSPN
jgi:hypothetical protein